MKAIKGFPDTTIVVEDGLVKINQIKSYSLNNIEIPVQLWETISLMVNVEISHPEIKYRREDDIQEVVA